MPAVDFGDALTGVVTDGCIQLVDDSEWIRDERRRRRPLRVTVMIAIPMNIALSDDSVTLHDGQDGFVRATLEILRWMVLNVSGIIEMLLKDPIELFRWLMVHLVRVIFRFLMMRVH